MHSYLIIEILTFLSQTLASCGGGLALHRFYPLVDLPCIQYMAVFVFYFSTKFMQFRKSVMKEAYMCNNSEK